jgi:hypothetical protein
MFPVLIVGSKTEEFRKSFATADKNLRRNRQMNNWLQNEPEVEELKYEKLFRSTDGTEMNQETSMSIKDPDTVIGMTMLLLACLALAVLAHAVI